MNTKFFVVDVRDHSVVLRCENSSQVVEFIEDHYDEEYYCVYDLNGEIAEFGPPIC